MTVAGLGMVAAGSSFQVVMELDSLAVEFGSAEWVP